MAHSTEASEVPEGVPSKRSLGSNMALSAVGNLALPLATFLSAPLLARALGVDGRGDLAGATAPLMLLVTIAAFGVPEAITVAVARSPHARRRASRSGMVILLIVGALATILAITLAPVLTTGSPTVTSIISLLSAAIIPTVMVGALRGSASGIHRWGLVNLEKTINGGCRFVGTLALFITNSLTVVTASLVIAAAPIVAAIAYLPLLRDHDQANELLGATRRETSPQALAQYGFRQWLGSVSGILLSRIDQVLMSPLAGSTQLGFYAVAVNVADVTLLANNAVRDVTLASDAERRSDELLTATARTSLIVSTTVGLAVIATGPLWFGWVFGPEFLDAIPASSLLVAASVLGVPGSVAGAGLAARGRPELRSLSIFVAMLANVALLLVLLPVAGAMGAAWATLAGNVLAANLNIYFCRRHFGIPMHTFYTVSRHDVTLLRTFSARALSKLPLSSRLFR